MAELLCPWQGTVHHSLHRRVLLFFEALDPLMMPIMKQSPWMCCRYDDLKTAQENIDLQSTILSRFDLIFIVKDERSIEKDQRIARQALFPRKHSPQILHIQA